MDKKTLKKFTIQNTGKYGKGVFSTRPYSKGEVVHTLSGNKLTLEQIVARVVSGNENEDDIFQIGKRRYYDLNEISRLFNHSCNPNMGIRKTSELFALRDIDKGEQLTYDYSTSVAPTDWIMRCHCGEKNCRRKIQDITTIPRKQLEYYVANGALQNYMKPILSQILKGTYKIPDYEKEALSKLHT